MRVSTRSAALFLASFLFSSVSLAQSVVPGAVPGEFSVFPSGAAGYRVGIAVPPGVSDMEPKLALSYSSQGGNGLMGVGWSIEGLSAVTRCGSTMASEGYRRGVGHNTDDRFCLDGQKLISVNGLYLEGAEYRTELESFSRIRAWSEANGSLANGPAYFTVQTKAGLTLEFGNSLDSRVEAQGKNVVRMWLLNRMTDAKGNAITFTYFEDNAAGESRISSISYAGRSVQFSYEARPDAQVMYELGSKVSITQRLKEISTRIGAQVVQRTQVTYSTGAATSRSRVQSIKQCGADGSCLKPLIFEMSDSTELGQFQTGSKLITETRFGGFDPSYQRRLADLNGDGIADLLYSYSGSAGARAYSWIGQADGSFQAGRLAMDATALGAFGPGYKHWVTDLNGDGIPDLLYAYAGDSGARAWAWPGKGDGTFGTAYLAMDLGGSFGGYTPQIADVNGDGLTDLIYTYAGPAGAYAWRWLGKSDGTFGPGSVVMSTSNQGGFDPYSAQVVDLNSDGILDLVYTTAAPSGAYVWHWLGNGDGTYQSAVRALAVGGDFNGYNPQIIDLNGDGIADLLYTYAGDAGAYAYRWLGNGDGTFQTGGLILGTAAFGGFPGYVAQTTDLNGDGYPDLLYTYAGPAGAAAYKWLGKGDGTFQTGSKIFSTAAFGGFDGYSVQIADLNSDGVSDLLYTSASGAGAHAYRWLGKGVTPDRLNAVTSSSGSVYQLEYKLLSDPVVYQKDTTARYPLADLTLPLPVVAKVSQSNGLGGLNATTYRYGGMKLEFASAPGKGRGLLGFRWNRSIDQASSVESYTEYRQDWPYIGQVTASQTRLAGAGNAGLLKQTANTFECYQSHGTPVPVNATTLCGTATPGKVYFPFVYKSEETSWDLNGAVMPVIETLTTYGGTADSSGKTQQYGDATAVETRILQDSVLKHRKRAANTYFSANTALTPGNGSWILGRLNRASVESFSPELPAAQNTATRVSRFEYDVQGVLTKEVIEPDFAQDCLQTTHAYDTYGNRVSSTAAPCAGASGNTLASASARASSATFAAQTVILDGVSYASPAGVFATQSKNALNQAENKEYDPRSGGISKLTGPNGLITTWTYDAFGRKRQETRADGTRSTWQYIACSVDGVRDPTCPSAVGGAAIDWYVIERQLSSAGVDLAPLKLQFHDTLGRALRVQTRGFDAAGAGSGPDLVQDTHYNAKGQVSQKSVIYALSGGSPKWSTYSYDALGRVLSETVPDGSTTVTTSFTYNGLITRTTNANGQTQTKIKNASGQVIDVKDVYSYDIVYTYDPLGQLIQSEASGTKTRLSYDRRGRKVKMEDPAMGVWDYGYNAFGELVWQQDSLGAVTTLAYDKLGRMTQRTEPDLVSDWSYDKKFDATGCGKGIGKLCEAKSNNGYRRVHAYDALGRPSSTATALDSATVLATVTQTYQANTGRLATQTWPTGFTATYTYTPAGFLKKVAGSITGDTQVASLEVLQMDAQGRITQYRQGNNVTTVKDFDAVTSKLNRVQATAAGAASGNLLNHTYVYDKLGNLSGRQDANTGLIESFAYDGLNRLTLATTQGGGLTSPDTVQVLYDNLGNIKYKSDVGYYSYDPARGTRLAQITLTQPTGWSADGSVSIANSGTRALSYAFDDARPEARTVPGTGLKTGNGNLWYTVSLDNASGRHTVRWESYTSFNAPKEIKYGNLTTPDNPTNATADRTLAYVYGPEHQRIKQTLTLTSGAPSHMEAGTTWYLNGTDSQGLAYEKEIKANGLTEHKHYINAAGISFAMYVKRTGTLGGKPAASLTYWHHDHLGSLAVISSATGTSELLGPGLALTH